MSKEKEKVVKTPEEEFDEKVAELKKTKSEVELLEIVSVQPAGHELRDFMAARKALDELGIKYSKSFESVEPISEVKVKVKIGTKVIKEVLVGKKIGKDDSEKDS